MKKNEIYDLKSQFSTKFNRGREGTEVYKDQRQKFKVGKNLYIFPVGADKVHVEVILDFRSVTEHLRLKREGWKPKRDKGTGLYSYSWSYKVAGEKQLFYFRLHRAMRKHPSREGSREEWVLSVQFNPSLWMGELGIKGAEKWKNYVAGSGAALSLALNKLAVLLATPQFEELREYQGEPLTVEHFSLLRVDLARDLHVRPTRKISDDGFCHQADWEEAQTAQILQHFLVSKVPYVSSSDPGRTHHWNFFASYAKAEKKKAKKNPSDSAQRWWAKEMEKRNLANQNPMGFPYRYLSRCVRARHLVFYIKERFSDGDGGAKLVGAPLRF